jgi:iron-sulfur cluster assembly protein
MGAIHAGGTVSTTNQPEVLMTVTPVAGVEVMKFMQQEGVDPAVGGLRVSVQPGGCSGFKYGLLIEDQAADDDLIVDQGEFKVFVDPFSAQYIAGVTIDYTSSMQGSGFTFKNPTATGGCGCGSSFSA